MARTTAAGPAPNGSYGSGETYAFHPQGANVLFADGSELPKLAILLATLAVLLGRKKVPEPFIVLSAAILGLLIYPIVRR